MMTATARIKAVERDVVFFVSIEWLAISQSHRNDSTVITAALRLKFEAKQVALLVAGEYFFHNSSYFLRRKLRCHDVVFVRNQVPDVVQRFGTGEQTGPIIERSMHHAINLHISLPQRFADRRADESLHIAWHPGAASTPQRLGQFADWRRKCSVRFGKLRFRSRNNHVIGMETVIHQLAARFPMEQLL